MIQSNNPHHCTCGVENSVTLNYINQSHHRRHCRYSPCGVEMDIKQDPIGQYQNQYSYTVLLCQENQRHQSINQSINLYDHHHSSADNDINVTQELINPPPLI